MSDDWKFYEDKLINKIKFAIERCKNLPKTCFIVAYSLEISGMDFSEEVMFDYEKQSHVCYELCIQNCKNAQLSELCKFISTNRKTQLKFSTLSSLFPNNTIIDNYFKSVL